MFHCMNVSLVPALSLNLHRCTLSGTCCLCSASPLLPSCSWLWFMWLAGSSDTRVRQSDAYGISARVICLPSVARSRLVSASWIFHEAAATPGLHIQLQLSPTHPPSTSTTLTHLLDLSLVLRPLIIISGFLFVVLADASFICNPALLSVYTCLKGRWNLWSVAAGRYILLSAALITIKLSCTQLSDSHVYRVIKIRWRSLGWRKNIKTSSAAQTVVDTEWS